MGINQIIHFLIVVEECRSPEEVIRELEKLLAAYGFDFYGLLKQPKPSDNPLSLVLAGRWPKGWPEIYVAKKYMLIDPTIRYLGLAQQGFRWRDAAPVFKDDPSIRRMERMMTDSVRHGLIDGYIFPVHGRNGLLGNMSVGGQPVDLSPVEISLFEQAAKKAFWRILELRGEAGELRLAAAVDTNMTRREMEVLSYLADGLTSNEISRLLKISAHTVDWYMNGIQEKLKARNRQHAVAIAFRLGLIN